MTLWTGLIGVSPDHQISQEQPSGPGKSLRCRARSEDFERKISIRFLVPDMVGASPQLSFAGSPNHRQILAAQSDRTSQESALLRLPQEILLDIFDAIAHAPSQIGFALTCKQLAQLAQGADLVLSVSSPKYAGFLPPAVFDVPDLMASLRSWMPANLRLCGHCLTYRPFDSNYWHGVDGFTTLDFWIQKIGWNFKDARWWKQTHDICPLCHFSCTLSDYVPCDGCRALGRFGDVDWQRVSDHWYERADSSAGLRLATTSTAVGTSFGGT